MPGHARVEDVSGLIDEAFSDMKKAINKVKKKFDEVMNNLKAMHSAASYVPGVQDNIDEVTKNVKKLLRLVEYAVKHEDPVISLVYQSFNWVDHVEKPMVETSARVDEHPDENIAYWHGDAASTFWDKAAVQQKAMDSYAQGADGVSQWLFKIAKTNVTYVTQLAEFAAKIAGALTQAAVDTGSLVDIPWAVDALAKQVGTIVENRLDNLIESANRFMDTLEDLRDVDSQLAKIGHGWPQAVA